MEKASQELVMIQLVRHLMSMKAQLQRLGTDDRIPHGYRTACLLKVKAANELADWIETGGIGSPPSPDGFVYQEELPEVMPVSKSSREARIKDAMTYPPVVKLSTDKRPMGRETEIKLQCIKEYLTAYPWSTTTQIARGVSYPEFHAHNVYMMLSRLDIEARGPSTFKVYALHQPAEEKVSA